MAGDREGVEQEHRGASTAPAGAAAVPGSTFGSTPVAAVTAASSAGPEHVAAVLRQFPAQRDAILRWLHEHRGNAFVQAVLAQSAPKGVPAWSVVATPHTVRFPDTEVGAVSPPCTITLINRGGVSVNIVSLELVLYGGTGEAAHPGEFELIQGQPGHLRPLETMAVQVVFRPTRVVPHIGAHLRATGGGAKEHVDVTLKAIPAPARADHADQRELSVAEHDARRLAVTTTPSVEHYRDMLAAVLAARTITDRAQPDDAEVRVRVTKLLEPVAKRLTQLNDHQGRLAQFGAGNIAGQAGLDMAASAVQLWLRRFALGTRVRTDELVTEFRAGAEPIRFLTGERADAPTLRAFDHVSSIVAVGAAVPVLAPALIALAAEEVPLLVFAGRVASRRVALWALAHPAAALAASEALLGFGLQIGEGGWEAFWDQLHDPQGRWFVIAQVLMDYMQVRSGMSGHDGANGRRSGSSGIEPTPDLEGARQRLARTRAILQQVQDGAVASEPGHGAAMPADSEAASVAPHPAQATVPKPLVHETLPSARPSDVEQPQVEPGEREPASPRNPAGRASVDGNAMPATDWVARLKMRLTPEELTQYELMKGKWKTPDDIQKAFHGDLDAAKQAIARAVGEKVNARAIKEASSRRAEQIREFVKERGILNQDKAVQILDSLPHDANATQLAKAARELRTIVVGDLVAEQDAARYPGARVLREVKVWEEQIGISALEFRALPVTQKHGFSLRTGADGLERVYKNMTDIDALVVESAPADGKAKILRFEQQKAGLKDTPSDAKAQNDLAMKVINAANAGGKSIRLELDGEVDITDQVDLMSAGHASRVTVGPAGKGFDESLGITAADLERLIKQLVIESNKLKNPGGEE